MLDRIEAVVTRSTDSLTIIPFPVDAKPCEESNADEVVEETQNKRAWRLFAVVGDDFDTIFLYKHYPADWKRGGRLRLTNAEAKLLAAELLASLMENDALAEQETLDDILALVWPTPVPEAPQHPEVQAFVSAAYAHQRTQPVEWSTEQEEQWRQFTPEERIWIGKKLHWGRRARSRAARMCGT